jgi:hypothetical protein
MSALPVMPAALTQRFLLQPRKAITLEIGLPSGQLLDGQQIAGTDLGGSQHAIADSPNNRDFLQGGPPHCPDRRQSHDPFPSS